MPAQHLPFEVHQFHLQHDIFCLQHIRHNIVSQFISLTDSIYQHGRKCPATLVMQGLPVTEVIDSRPRNHWPAVIELPDQTAHAIRTIPTMRFHSLTHSVSLQHQSQIHQVLKFFRNQIIQSHGLLNQEIAN